MPDPVRFAVVGPSLPVVAALRALPGRGVLGQVSPPYPLADACQDAQLGHLVHRAAERGSAERSATEPGAPHVRGAG